MQRRLFQSAPLAFITMLLGYKYLLHRTWLSSLAGALVWIVVFLITMLLFIKWWTRKVAEQNNKR